MRLKSWQAITLVLLAVLDCAVLGVGFAIVAAPTTPQPTPVPVAVIHTATALPLTFTNTPLPTPTPTATDTPMPMHTPGPTDSPTITSTPTKTQPPTKTSTSTRTPRPTPTATPPITDSDAAYIQDMSKCLILWPEVAKDSERLISAIKNGTLYNAEYCVNLAAMASVGIDTIFSCIDTSHVPDDNDLKLSRSSFVNGLRDARSAWTLLGFGCTSGAFDSRTMPLMDKYAQELNKGMDAFNRYRARYPQFK